MKKSKTGAIALGVAFVWFTTHFGGGFASGAQIYSYFVRYGAWCILMPVLAMAYNGVFFAYSLRFARKHQTYDYRSYNNAFYGKYAPIFSNLFELLYLCVMCVAPAVAFATGGATLSQLTGLPYLLCTFLKKEIHKNLGNRMKPGVPAHGASRFTTQLPLLQDRTGLDMPAQPGAKSAVQDSHTAVSFYSRRASRGSVVKPPWNTGPNAAREDMPRKGLNKAERHTRKRRKEEASFLLPHGECWVRGDAPQESLGLPSGPPFSKGEEDLPHDDGTCCYPNCCHCRHCRHRFGWWKLGRFLSPVCEGAGCDGSDGAKTIETSRGRYARRSRRTP